MLDGYVVVEGGKYDACGCTVLVVDAKGEDGKNCCCYVLTCCCCESGVCPITGCCCCCCCCCSPCWWWYSITVND
jgi:hypothetical protein